MLITSYPVKYAAILMKQRGTQRSGHEADFADLMSGLLWKRACRRPGCSFGKWTHAGQDLWAQIWKRWILWLNCAASSERFAFVRRVWRTPLGPASPRWPPPLKHALSVQKSQTHPPTRPEEQLLGVACRCGRRSREKRPLFPGSRVRTVGPSGGSGPRAAWLAAPRTDTSHRTWPRLLPCCRFALLDSWIWWDPVPFYRTEAMLRRHLAALRP